MSTWQINESMLSTLLFSPLAHFNVLSKYKCDVMKYECFFFFFSKMQHLVQHYKKSSKN